MRAIRCILVSMTGLAAACGGPSLPGIAAGPGRGAAPTVRRGSFRERFLLTGELQAVRSEVLSVPRIPTWQTTLRWLEADGAVVKAGQRIAEFDNTAFVSDMQEKRLQADQAQSDLDEKEAEAAAAVSDKEFQLEQRRLALERARTDAAVPESLLPLRQYQERQLALARAEMDFRKAEEDLAATRTSSKEDVRQRQIALEKARREIDTAERALSAMTLVAPRDGIVVVADHPWEGRKIQVGDTVWVGLPIVRIPELHAMQVEAALSDVDDGRITTGMGAVCTLDTYPDLRFHGRVVEINSVAQADERRSLRRTFRATIVLDETDPERMRPGMSVKVEVETARRDAVLLAPRSALDLSADPPRARLEDGRAVEVRLGMCNASDCIVESGLAEGAKLRRRG